MNSTTSIIRNVPNKNDIRVLLVNWNEKTIGYLMKERGGDYFYKYDHKGLQEARKQGYQYLVGFKDIRKVYTSKDLFPAFKSRIPTKQRRDLPNILAELGIESYDEFDLLALSGGRLLTDAISFEEYFPDKNVIKGKRIQKEDRSCTKIFAKDQGEKGGR